MAAHVILGEWRSSVDGECCSELAHANCRFADKVSEQPSAYCAKLLVNCILVVRTPRLKI